LERREGRFVERFWPEPPGSFASECALGIVGALALTHLISSLLFGITPFDTSVFKSVPVLLTVIAFIASYIPARRASSINPMDALRCK